ncbi:MAG: hypothetical protein R6U31_02390 [bacterium]
MSYSNNTEILFRKKKKSKKRMTRVKNSVRVLTMRLLLACFILFILYTGARIFIAKTDFFNIKSISVVCLNSKDELSLKPFMLLRDSLILDIDRNSAEGIVREHFPGYGIRAVNKRYPSSVTFVLYKKIPVICINGRYSVNQDGSVSVKRNTDIIRMNADIDGMESIFDIPGFPTIFSDIIRQSKYIENIKYSKREFTIETKDNKHFTIVSGNSLGNLKELGNAPYSAFDMRINEMTLVKN